MKEVISQAWKDLRILVYVQNKSIDSLDAFIVKFFIEFS